MHFELVSHQRSSLGVLQKINRLTSTAMSNGLWNYQKSVDRRELIRRSYMFVDEDDEIGDGFDGITIEQMKMPVSILLAGMAISLFVFIIEVIVSRMKQQRSQRNEQIQQRQRSGLSGRSRRNKRSGPSERSGRSERCGRSHRSGPSRQT